MSLYPNLPQEDYSDPNHLNLQETHSLLPVCSVCLDDFNEAKRPPKYLSCHHTFCEECIHQLVRAGEVECPLCRHVTKLSSHQLLQTNNDVLTMVKYGNMIVNLWCEDCGTPPQSTCNTHNVINKAATYKQNTFVQQLGSTVEAWQPTVVRVVETAQGWGVVAADLTYTTITTVGEYVAPIAAYVSDWFSHTFSSIMGSSED
ncbi:hypothetical protein Pcinc_037349 [Petrolisthes cinctipes]|uniref:RING-type domain-containing protein n=1 Tax=Petrolisthes cinctipes TaxID=88211 RepID=A0AAE1BTQ7_PETCI|nr:hypothetical protein Pcinc_037349 [Petrolisthes cinctipes]